MAGILKPDIVDLGLEGNIEFGDDFSIQASPTNALAPLIDGINSRGSYVLLDLGSYFYFTINQESSIWAIGFSGSDGGGSHGAPVKLYKVVNGEENYIRTYPTQNDYKWYKLFDKIPAGTYKAEYTGRYTLWTEWYVETIAQFLINHDNKYYSINNEFYDSTSKAYIPLDNVDFKKSFSINQLITATTMNGDTFIPIDKFNTFKLISKEEQTVSVKALKSFRELIVASNDIHTNIASNIDYFKLYAKKLIDSSIKIAISIDCGNIWNTIDNSVFTPLLCTIPKKHYASLTDTELLEWNNARDIVFEQGITIETFNSLDFNTLVSDSLDYKQIRFAYVLDINTPNDVVETNKLEWQFDAKGSMQLMKDTEQQIDIYGRSIKYKSLIDNPLIKVNVML